MKKIVYISFLFFCLITKGQDGQFSQYFSSPALINPAIVGVIPELEFSSNYKSGGNESSGTFVELIQASLSYPLRTKDIAEKQFGGVGATFFRENRGFRGIYQSQKFLLTGAYTLKISEFNNQYISFGLQGGIVQTGLSDENILWGSQFNRYLSEGYDRSLPSENLDGQNVYYPTFNFGMVFTAYDNNNIFVRDRSFTFGISADNLNRPVTGSNENGEIRKQILFKAFGSGKVELSPRFYLYPSFLGTYIGNSYQVNAGTYLTTLVNSVKSRTSILIHIGSWYRLKDSVILLGGFQVNQIRISGSYDLNTSQQGVAAVFGESDPTYELSLTYTLVRDKSYRKVSNPIF